MNNAALAQQLEQDLVYCLRDESTRLAHQPTQKPSSVTLPLQPRAAPRGFLQRLWQRLFGPPAIDPTLAETDFGVFRALYEMGSDHPPNIGTWPGP